MKTVLGISGSLREGSFNTALLRAAQEIAPGGIQLELASIRGIPLYDADVEAADGIPRAVEELKERIARADALLLATPEYNQSIPGVFKNAIDWLSRPPKDIGRVFGGKKVGLIGATPGRGGTRAAQTAWLQVFRALGVNFWFGGQLYVTEAGRVFEQGALVDAPTREQLAKYLAGFARFVEGG